MNEAAVNNISNSHKKSKIVLIGIFMAEPHNYCRTIVQSDEKYASGRKHDVCAVAPKVRHDVAQQRATGGKGFSR